MTKEEYTEATYEKVMELLTKIDKEMLTKDEFKKRNRYN